MACHQKGQPPHTTTWIILSNSWAYRYASGGGAFLDANRESYTLNHFKRVLNSIEELALDILQHLEVSDSGCFFPRRLHEQIASAKKDLHYLMVR